MAAVLRIGSTDYDLYFTSQDPGDHLQDVPRINPAYLTSGLSLPPLPRFPDPRLNVVVWPVTGLSHYAVGHVLVANDTASTTGTSCTLEMTDAEADVAREMSLYILNRRPLSDTRTVLATAPDAAVENPFDGWILTLVDARYLRRRTVRGTDAVDATTWGKLINTLGVLAGFTMQSYSTIQALVHADFGTPNVSHWSAAALVGESAAVSADAAALACGLRLVVGIDGSVVAQKAATSDTAYAAWLTAVGRDEFSAGGIVADRYGAPLKVECGGVEVSLPSPTPRLADTDVAVLASTDSAFRTKWVAYLSDWWAAVGVSGDMRGLVTPPPIGTVQHAEYDLPACRTRIVKHPTRYPLPLMARDRTGLTAEVGPTVRLVSNVCGSVVEYVTVTLPAGSVVSPPTCVTSPTDCCAEPTPPPEGYTCPTVCGEPYPDVLWMDYEVTAGPCASGCSGSGIVMTPEYITFYDAGGNPYDCLRAYTATVTETCGGTSNVMTFRVELCADGPIPTPLVLNASFNWLLAGPPAGACTGVTADPAAYNGIDNSIGPFGLGEMQLCSEACDATGFATASFTWAQVANAGKWRVYRPDVAPPPYCTTDSTPPVVPTPAVGCPPNCNLAVRYTWDDGLGDSGFSGFTLPLDYYDPLTGVTTWEYNVTTRCGTNYLWTATCDADGDLSLVCVDPAVPAVPVFEATFVESATDVWTGTIVTACGNFTTVEIRPACGVTTTIPAPIPVL